MRNNEEPQSRERVVVGPEKLLIFIPGGDVPNENYTLTSKAIQKVACTAC